MEVVARGELVGQLLQEGRVAVVDVEEGHRVANACVARREADVHERIEVAQATGGIGSGRVAHAAVRLLPHLVEAMARVPRVGVVRHRGAGELERPVGQVRRVGHARVDAPRWQAGGAGGQEDEVTGLEVELGRRSAHRREGRRRRIARRRVSSERVRRGQRGVRRLDGRADVEGRLRRHRELTSEREVRPGGAIGVDDGLGHEVPDGLAMLRPVRAEDVVEAPVLGDDDDDVLDRCLRVLVRFLLRRRA